MQGAYCIKWHPLFFSFPPENSLKMKGWCEKEAWEASRNNNNRCLYENSNPWSEGSFLSYKLLQFIAELQHFYLIYKKWVTCLKVLLLLPLVTFFACKKIKRKSWEYWLYSVSFKLKVFRFLKHEWVSSKYNKLVCNFFFGVNYGARKINMYGYCIVIIVAGVSQQVNKFGRENREKIGKSVACKPIIIVCRGKGCFWSEGGILVLVYAIWR